MNSFDAKYMELKENKLKEIISKEKTVTKVAEELEVKPGVIKKAIRVAQKGSWQTVFEEFDDLDTIVDISGHKK